MVLSPKMSSILVALLLFACPHRPPPVPAAPEPTPPDPAPRWEPSDKEVVASSDGAALLVTPLALGGDTDAPGAIWSAAPVGSGLLLGIREFGAALYDPARPAELRNLGVAEVQALAADRTGSFAVVGDSEGLHGIDLGTGVERWQVAIDENPGIVAVFPDGRSFVVAIGDRVDRRDTATGALLWTWKADPPATDNQPDTVGALALSPDGGTVFTHSYNRVVVLAAGDGAFRKDVVRLDNFVGALAVSPNGEWLLAGGWDQSCRLVRLSDAREMLNIQMPGWVTSVAWAPDGSTFALLDIGGHLELRAADGTLIGTAAVSEDSTSGLVWLESGVLVSWASEEAFTVTVP